MAPFICYPFALRAGAMQRESIELNATKSEVTQGQSAVVERLLRKRDLLRRGDPAHAEIRAALFIDGGGMRGVYGGGVVIALERLGLTDVFDHVIGVSAGAANSAYFLSGQTELGTTIYYEELAGRKFINPLRLHKILDIDYLDVTFRHTKPLNYDRIRQSRSQFWIGVTRTDTAACEYLNMKDSSIDIITAIRASTALPIVYNRNIMIHGVPYSDGNTACGIPVDFILDELNCDTVLFVLNRLRTDKDTRISWFNRVLTHVVSGHYSSEFRSAFLNRRVPYNQSLAIARGDVATSPGVEFAMIAPEDMPITNLTSDSVKLKRVAEQATKQTLEFFASPGQFT
jgi:predicted patatin/cPLA2 family phospholipase